jgi:hypothetical protein
MDTSMGCPAAAASQGNTAVAVSVSGTGVLAATTSGGVTVAVASGASAVSVGSAGSTVPVLVNSTGCPFWGKGVNEIRLQEVAPRRIARQTTQSHFLIIKISKAPNVDSTPIWPALINSRAIHEI